MVGIVPDPHGMLPLTRGTADRGWKIQGEDIMTDQVMNSTTDGVPKKKGLGTLAWIGIGCGTLVVIVSVVLIVVGLFAAKKLKDVAGDLDFEGNPEMASARLFVRMNPELEEVAVDEEAGTLTVRHKDSGETVTVGIDDLKEGRFKFTTDEGEVTIDATGSMDDGTISVTRGDESWKLKTGIETSADLPSWVPVYPGAEVDSPHVVVSEGRTSGGFQLSVSDEVAAVVGFYRSQLEADHFAVRVNEFSAGEGEAGAVVNGSGGDDGRSVTVMIRSDDDGSTRVVVSFQEGE